jgi:glycosyltransferase involved in cell wall biosynthesis
VSSQSKLRVLTISHGAVSRDIGRLRYHPLAVSSRLDVHLVAPACWREYDRMMFADPKGDPGVTLHVEPILLPYLPVVNWYAHLYPRLGKLIRSIQPDVIHLWEEPWSFVALQATLLRGSAALVLEVDQNILKRLPPPFEAIRRYVLRRTDLILARSPDAAAVVRARGFCGPARPVGYGVDQSVFRPLISRRAAPARGAPLRIGYVGRLIEEKGLDDVVTAMTLVEQPVELAIMGEGPHEGRLRKRARDLGLERRVAFRGWGSASEVADFIKMADITVLLTWTTASVREQFGRAIVESQSCGVPVIGSTCGAIPSVVAEGGWIIPEHDPKGLAQVLERLHASPDEIAARGAAGLKNVAARFTYEMTAQTLDAAWNEAHNVHRQSEVYDENV